jgi:hypothetical protein
MSAMCQIRIVVTFSMFCSGCVGPVVDFVIELRDDQGLQQQQQPRFGSK